MRGKYIPQRYNDYLKHLEEALRCYNAFEMRYNEDKENWSFPYCFDGYVNKVIPITLSASIFNAIKKYLTDNLFSNTEQRLLLEYLNPSIKSYGDESISHLQQRLDLLSYLGKPTDAEYTKTIQELRTTREILNDKVTEYYVKIGKIAEQKTHNEEYIGKLESDKDLIHSMQEEKAQSSVNSKADELSEMIEKYMVQLKDAFRSEDEYKKASETLYNYFKQNKRQKLIKPIFIRSGNIKRLCRALGNIHRDTIGQEIIGVDYLEFAKATFSCLNGQRIEKNNITRSTFYKYFKG